MPAKPLLIAISGLYGTGRSLVARALALRLPPLPGAVVLGGDVERMAMFGASQSERLPDTAYTPDVTAKVYARLAEKARRVTGAGYSALVDAVFAQPGERTDVAKSAGDAAFQGLFLTANLETRLSRIGTRTGDASDADAVVARKQEQFDLGRINWSRVDASGTPEETLIRAEAMLGRK